MKGPRGKAGRRGLGGIGAPEALSSWRSVGYDVFTRLHPLLFALKIRDHVSVELSALIHREAELGLDALLPPGRPPTPPRTIVSHHRPQVKH